jgi:predicted HicB family RNase H-like nuclease
VNQTDPQVEPKNHAPFSEHDPRCAKVYRAAKRLFERQPDWVVFFRRILGSEGIVRRIFPSGRELQQFEQTETHVQLLELLTRLRERQSPLTGEPEPTRVITVRLPQSLHESLRTEAYRHCTSMNKLCISKLLQFIEAGLVPKNL